MVTMSRHFLLANHIPGNQFPWPSLAAFGTSPSRSCHQNQYTPPRRRVHSHVWHAGRRKGEIASHSNHIRNGRQSCNPHFYARKFHHRSFSSTLPVKIVSSSTPLLRNTALNFANVLPPSQLGTRHPNLDSFLSAVKSNQPNDTVQNDNIHSNITSSNQENETKCEHSTLIILTNLHRQQILLGKKLRGFGTGKYNGFGGRLESKISDPTPAHGARRELMEEASISIPLEEFQKGSVGTLNFTFQDKVNFSMVVNLFHVNVRFDDDQNETRRESYEYGTLIDPNTIQGCDEMIPEWFDWSEIPLHKMFADDSIWLTHYLTKLSNGGNQNEVQRGKMNGWFHFGPGGDNSNQIFHYFLDTTMK